MHSRGTSGQISAWNIVTVCIIVGVVFVLIGPLVLRPGHGGCGQISNCASNMKQIGASLTLYLQDWHGTYPTNRPRLQNGNLGPISCRVTLTAAGTIDQKTNKQVVGGHGVNWVEALYDYMEPPSPDSNGAWECKSACLTAGSYPARSRTAYATYVLNRNLVGRPEMCISQADRLMLVREMDRHANSELRPTNYSCGRPNVPPDSPFLNGSDSRLGKTETRLHGVGSHILFADRHVQLFPDTAYPTGRVLPKRCWDATEKRWYNSLTGRYAKKIAVTP